MIKIFNANDRDFSTAGNIIIEPIKCQEFKKKSLNGWYVDIKIPIEYKEYIEADKLCVLKTKSKKRPQAFRIGEEIEITSKYIKFSAKHVMFDSEKIILLDVRPTKLNGINALNYINKRTDEISPFTIYSNIENVSTAYFIRKTLFEAWSVIEERWNGIFDADNWDISFLQKIGNDNGETIAYGKNIKNMQVFEDWSNVVTKLYPVGYDGITIPEDFLKSDVQYDVPYTKIVDFSTNLELEEQTPEKLINELRTNAIEYLEKNKYPKINYTLNANINNDLEIGDTIQILHPLAIIKTEVIEYEFDNISEKIKSITFGNYTRDVKKKFDNIKNNINQINQVLSKQENVISKQTELINSLNKNGYVYIDENEILILDQLPKEQSKNVWRFGLGGIGFSSNGYEGPFELAITMDGQINANFITTGTMSISRIEGLANQISEFTKNIASINIELNKIQQRVDHMEDFTREQTETNQIHLSDTVAGAGYITNFKIYGDTEYFKYLAPSNNLTSSDNLVPLGDHFTLVLDTQGRAEKSKNAIEIDILLGEPLRNIKEVRDYLSIDGNIVSVTRKIGVNESNELYELEKPTYEEIGKLELPSFDENTYIYVDEYYNLNYYAKYIIKNAYSETYATKVELKSAISETEKNVNISVDEKLEKYSTIEETNSAINLKSDEIASSVSKTYATKTENSNTLENAKNYADSQITTAKTEIKQTTDSISSTVSKKIGKEEVVSSINQTSDKIALKGNRISIKSNYFELTEEGKIIAISGKIGGFELKTEKFSGNLNGVYSFDLQDVCLLLNYLNDNTSLTSELKNIYDVNNDGTLDILDVVTMLNILKGKTENTKNVKGTIVFNSKDPKNAISIKDQYGNILSSFSVFGINTENISARRVQIGQFETANDNKFVGISLDSEKNLVNVTNGTNSSKIEPTKMQSQAFNNNSLEELKKNIEKQENAMDIVKNSEIYKFNYKDENNDDKKHIGFIIGKKYKTPEELLNKEKNAIDIYSMASINWKCTQEILEELKNTKEELEELKKEVAKK